MQNEKKWLVAVGLMLVAGAALATPPNVNTVLTNFEMAGTGISERLVALAKKTAVAALLLQWIISYSKEIFNSHEAKDYIGKAVMMIMWFGATIWLIDNVNLLAVIFRQYAALAGEISGVSAGDFTPWGVILKAREVIDATHNGISAKLGGSWYSFGSNFLAAATLIIADVIVIVAFMIIGLSLFVVTVEFWLIFAVTPLALALIPLNALRDQGIAPLKGLLSVGLRILILGVIVAVAQSLSDTLIASITAEGFPGDPESGSVLARMLEYHAGILGCAAMSLYAGKIASAIASGSASFTGADAMAAGSAMAAGAAVATAGAAGVAGAVGKAAAATGVGDVGKAAAGAMSKLAGSVGTGAPGVSPVTGGPGSVGASSFGQPLQSKPPSSGSSTGAGSTGAGSTGAGSTGAGNTGAGNTGAGNTGAGNAGSNEMEASKTPASIGGSGNSGASNWEKLQQGSKRLTDSLERDQASVSVQVNLGADK